MWSSMARSLRLVEVQRAHALEVALVERPAAAEELHHRLELRDGHVAELRHRVLAERPPDRAPALAHPRGELHVDLAPVLGVADAPRVAGALEAVEDPGHGRGREAAELGQAPCGERPLVLDDVEAPPV